MNAQSCWLGELTPADIELIFDALAEGILILSPEGRILLVNKAACGILGIDRHQAMQLVWKQLRTKQSAVNLSPLPASAEELCKIDRLDMELPGGDRTNKVVCGVRAIFRPDGQPQLVVLVLAAARQESAALRPEKRTDTLGPWEAAGPSAQQASGSQSGGMGAASWHEQRELLCRTLQATGWNVAKAARRLKLSRTTLYARIARYGLVRPKE